MEEFEEDQRRDKDDIPYEPMRRVCRLSRNFVTDVGISFSKDEKVITAYKHGGHIYVKSSESEKEDWVPQQYLLDTPRGPHLLEATKSQEEYLSDESSEHGEEFDDFEEEDASTGAIKITNLPDQVEEEDIENFFSSARRTGGGPITSVELHNYDNSAIVTFEDPSVVDRVLSKQPILFKKKAIKIEVYEKPVPTVGRAVRGKTEADDKRTIEVRNYREDTDEEAFMDYFENERKSGGGLNTVKMDAENDRVLVTFESVEVAKRVLKKTSHKLYGAELQVSQFIPRETYPNKVLVHNINRETDEESLQNFVEAKCDLDVSDLERVNDTTAILTFKESVDFNDFQQKATKRKLKGNTLTCEMLPVVNSITVTCPSENIEKETIELYFENARKSGGGEVGNVIFRPDTKDYVVSFVDHEVIDKVIKREHTLKRKKLSVGVFYDFLEKKQENMSPTKYPRPVEISAVDPLIYKYLTDSPVKREISDLFRKHYAKLSWPDSSSYNLLIECTIPRDDKNVKEMCTTWRKDVESCYEGMKKDITFKTYRPLKDAMTDILNEVETLTFDHKFMLDADSTSFSVIGKKNEVFKVFEKIDDICKNVERKLQGKANTVVETVSTIKQGQLRMLKAVEFDSRARNTYAGLKVNINVASKEVSFHGSVSDVQAAKLEMYEICSRIKEGKLEHFSDAKLNFLSTDIVQSYLEKHVEEAHFKKKCVWNRNGSVVEVFALSDEDLVGISTLLKTAIVEHTKDVQREYLPLLQTDEWERKCKEIRDLSPGLVQIQRKDQRLHILTTEENAGSIIQLVESFFSFNTKTIIMERGVIRYLEQECKADVLGIEKSLQDQNVKLAFARDRIKVTGTSDGIRSAEQIIQFRAQKISSRHHTVDKPEAEKYLLRKGTERLSKLEKDNHCVVEIGAAIPAEKVEKQSKTEPEVVATHIAKNYVSKQECKLVVLSGDLTALKVDVIVNAANTKLDHCGGIAKAIVDKGGEIIREECSIFVKTNGPLKNGDVFESSAGSLQCEAIYHAVGPVWSDGNSNESSFLAEAVYKCLDMCNSQNHKSIAFPAISTGIFNFPVQDATRVIIETAKEFLEEIFDCSVREIYFCDINDTTVQTFSHQLKKTFGIAESDELAMKKETSRTVPLQPGIPFRSSSPTSTSTISIKVVKGQISEQKVDVIVNTTSLDLNLRVGSVSRSILQAAGEELQDLCYNGYPDGIQYGDIAITTGAELKCYIFHGALETWNTDGSSLKNMKSFMNKCLTTADMEGMSSIAFPALGTGKLNYPKEIVAKEMFDLVLGFSPTSIAALKEVVFVIYERDAATYQAFQMEEQRRKARNDESARTSRQYGRREQVTDDYMLMEYREPNKEKGKHALTLTIYAEEDSCFRSAIQAIDKMFERAFSQIFLEGDRMQHPRESQIENLKEPRFVAETPEKKLGMIRMRVLPEGIAKRPSLKSRHWSGILEEKSDEDHVVAVLSGVAEWCYLEVTKRGQDLVPYPSAVNKEIEKDFRGRKAQTTFVTDGKTFVVDFENMEEFPHDDPDDRVKVIRKEKISGEPVHLPSSWKSMKPNKNVSKIALELSSYECNDVLKKFMASMRGKTVNKVSKVQRIQNKTLYRQYEAKKLLLEAQNPGHQNEMTLWHGVVAGVEDIINMYGFNRSYCGKNGTAYGNGVSFAVSASKAAGGTGVRRIYQCRVLTGVPTLGKCGLFSPPVKSGHTLYDSVFDRLNDTRWYVVFSDNQVYPEYLITFE